MTDASLVERLAAHRTIGSAPREQLEWLAAHGSLVRLEPGDTISEIGKPLEQLYVILSGRATIRVDRGTGPRMVMEWRGGDISGVLPYSRLTIPPGTSTVEETTEVLSVDRAHFPEMSARCHELTAILVHVMQPDMRRAATALARRLLDRAPDTSRHRSLRRGAFGAGGSPARAPRTGLAARRRWQRPRRPRSS